MGDDNKSTRGRGECEECDGGWGHEVWMTKNRECHFACFVCGEAFVIDTSEDMNCCGHRYVGEDRVRGEDYFGHFDCVGCSGSHGEHSSDCMFNFEEDDDEEEEIDFE